MQFAQLYTNLHVLIELLRFWSAAIFYFIELLLFIFNLSKWVHWTEKSGINRTVLVD